jgi:hypothetical protein
MAITNERAVNAASHLTTNTRDQVLEMARHASDWSYVADPTLVPTKRASYTLYRCSLNPGGKIHYSPAERALRVMLGSDSEALAPMTPRLTTVPKYLRHVAVLPVRHLTAVDILIYILNHDKRCEIRS